MSKQTTLGDFFAIKNKKRSIFYIDWTHPFPKAQWLTDKPSSINFEAQVKWKELNTVVTICCNDSNDRPYKIPPELKYKNTALLKSHLQKCVRRQLTDKALKTSWHLIKLDINAFIRRLPIIMLEDVDIHDSLSTIIWLIAAISKGYLPDYKQISWLLGVVVYISNNKQYGKLENNHASEEINIPSLIKKINNNNNLSDMKKDLLYSLLFRVSYGGMKGDMNMFYNYAKKYCENINNASLYSPIIPIECSTLIDLEVDEIEISSADFHCYPQIIKMIASKFPQYTNDQIKKCIWDCNSKYNSRYDQISQLIDKKMGKIWENIQSYIQHLQKHLIESSH